jgi:hypothetical protein
MTTYIWPEGGGGGGGVTSVTASLPLASSGGATPDISITAGTVAGDVLTWDGSVWAGAAPTDNGITELTGDVTAGPGNGSQAATVAKIQGNAISSTAPTSNQILQWISGTLEWTPTANGVGLGSKVLLVVEGGAYATIQAAINAAAAHDVILVGPKAVNPADPTETLSWGPAVFSPGKPLTVVGLGGDQVSEAPRVDSVTFDVSSGANILLNTVVIKGLFINSNFSAITAGVNFQGTFPARLRLQDCFVYNKSVVSGTAVRSANSNGSSTFFLDGCVVQTGASTGIGVDHVAGFTSLRGETVIDRFQYGVRCAAGTCEMIGARLDGTGAVGEVVRVLGGRVLATYSTIRNDTPDSSGVNLVAAGAVFGAGFSTFIIATGSGYCVNGPAAATPTAVYLYGSVTYSNSLAAAYNVKVKNTISAIAVAQAFISSP